MALTGLQIYKYLPKTNCKKCGFPTCLAFAMKLAQKGAELSACPDISQEAKEALDAAAQPPIRLVTVGAGEEKFCVGNEIVLFRHEKTFFHQPGLMVRVRSSDPLERVEALVSEVDQYRAERVGINLCFNGIAVENTSRDATEYVRCVEMVQSATKKPLVLMSSDTAAMARALEKAAASKPLLYAANKGNATEMAKLARQHGCPLAVHEPAGLAELAGLVQQVTQAGVADVVLDPGARGFGPSLVALTQLRRLALKKNFRLLGYPVITFPGKGASSVEEETLLAAQHVCKYAGIIVLDHFSPTIAYPLLTLRLNIYTDPQKPIQVTAGVYPIRDPKPESPVVVTTNFSLTYFSVMGEVEASGVPTWMVITDTEGLSVLTAWAAGKFDAEKIAKEVKGNGIMDKISHRELIIPGHVAVISGELEDELSGWTIRVGPREAVDLPRYLRSTQAARVAR